MIRTSSTLFKIVISLLAFNFLCLFLYFSSHNHQHAHSHDKPPTVTENRSLNRFQQTDYGPPKPWPILPSYLPWTQNLKVNAGSCEAYFGNGFTRRLDLRSGGSGAGEGWFRCFYSETLKSSLCEGGSLRMVPEKVKMSAGGERIQEVIGRPEEDELPEYQDGAFQVLGSSNVGKKLVGEEFLDAYVREGDVIRHTMRELIGSIEVANHDEFQCDQWIEEPTLLVTRFEYANLFHTVTDWYSAYVASRVTDLPYRPRLFFVDGHAQSPLEETWKALFSGLTYAKSFSGPVCFRHAVLVPLGYETALFKGLREDVNCEGASAHALWQNPDDYKTARLSEFGEMIRTAFGFSVNRHGTEKPLAVHSVLFVRREDYLAHPRHGGRVESRLSNEKQVFDALLGWASNHQKCKVNLVNGLFAHMPMKEQVRAIQEASVIVGAHGAGLTHIVSATPKTVILEIISAFYRRPHFQLIAQWKGLEYHAINLDGSYADPGVVVDKLSRIMESLGC